MDQRVNQSAFDFGKKIISPEFRIYRGTDLNMTAFYGFLLPDGLSTASIGFPIQPFGICICNIAATVGAISVI